MLHILLNEENFCGILLGLVSRSCGAYTIRGSNPISSKELSLIQHIYIGSGAIQFPIRLVISVLSLNVKGKR